MAGTRPPAVAGQFYAADEDVLREQVRDAITHPLGPGEEPMVGTGPVTTHGLVSPHAGLPYSGPVAAHGYGEVASQGRPDVVVVVGPNHTGLGDPIAVSDADRWRTPLGTVDVHDGVRDAILSASDLATSDDRAHRREHAVEVQLPFLQYLYDDPPAVVPITMRRQDREAVADLGGAFADVTAPRNESVLLIASTDLTHYESQAVAERRDGQFIDRIESLDADGLLDVAEREESSMCGYGPTAAILRASCDGGATAGRCLQYATSGDVAGPAEEVVGYCSAALE